MEAYTREENITIKAPVIILKLTHDEAKYLICAIRDTANYAAWDVVGMLTTQLENPSSEYTAAKN
jgi:hypothetical protein